MPSGERGWAARRVRCLSGVWIPLGVGGALQGILSGPAALQQKKAPRSHLPLSRECVVPCHPALTGTNLLSRGLLFSSARYGKVYPQQFQAVKGMPRTALAVTVTPCWGNTPKSTAP